MVSIKEKDIQKIVLDYLRFKKIFHWRNNTGAYKTPTGGFLRFGAIGSPDVFAVKNGRIYGLEVKTVKGTQSDVQRRWSEEFTVNGGLYFIIRSLEDIIQLFK